MFLLGVSVGTALEYDKGGARVLMYQSRSTMSGYAQIKTVKLWA